MVDAYIKPKRTASFIRLVEWTKETRKILWNGLDTKVKEERNMADKTLKAYHFDFGWIGSLIVVGYSLEVAKANAIVLINENKEKEKRWF